MKALMLLLMLFCVGCMGCGKPETINKRTDHHSPQQEELDRLKDELLKLQGTIAQIDAFVANDFADCTSGLPAFETKICQISQTATAQERILYTQQLGEVAKVFQDEIYGEDCINTTDVGCPVADSMTSDIESIQVDIASNNSDVAQVVADIATLNSNVSTLELELDAIEVRLTSAEAAIVALENAQASILSRLDDLEEVVANGDIFKTYQLCGDIANSGPIYEAVLMSGDKSFITAFITTGSKSGLGVLRTANDGDGDTYHSTRVNTRKCKFNIYDDTTELKICWNNADRSAAQAEINTECDSANSFANPTLDCTCTE
jgi:hypothetical protein